MMCKHSCSWTTLLGMSWKNTKTSYLRSASQMNTGLMAPLSSVKYNFQPNTSFLLRKSTSLYNRRESKICSTLTSYFTSCYVFHWKEYFPGSPLLYPPSFDGRIVVYPSSREIRDYFSWRQADSGYRRHLHFDPMAHILPAHINNLYNTIFWALVQQGDKTTTDAHAALRVR